jgi:hypothetical protein
MATNDTGQAQSPGALLDEMGRLRRRARADRHAYWFPLLVFGLIEAGSAPFYYRNPHCAEGELCSGQLIRGGLYLGRWYLGASQLYALVASLAGLGLTVWWYRRHARRVGVRTGTRGPLLAWTATSITVAILVIIPAFVFLWVLWIRNTSWLLAIAVALLALAWAERSVLLGAVAAVHAVAVGLGVFYDPENLLYRVLSAFGVADYDMPFGYGGTVNVLLPAVVLLLGGLLALALDRWRAG